MLLCDVVCLSDSNAFFSSAVCKYFIWLADCVLQSWKSGSVFTVETPYHQTLQFSNKFDRILCFPIKMSSNVLYQAVYRIPRNTAHCGPTELRFSALVSGRPTSFCSSVSLNSSGFIFGKFKGHRNVVLRAEGNSDGIGIDNEENEEENEGSEIEEAEIAEDEVVEAEERPPRKPRIKLGEIMGILNKRAIEESDKVRPTPDIRSGDIVEIKLEVPENRRRLSIYKGIVISKQNAGIHTTIRIRRIIAGIGVEIIFPVYSPAIKEIKVVNHRKVRRARLYYLREKLPRLSTFK